MSLPDAKPLDALLRGPRLWRGAQLARIEACSTGFAALDARLPGGGWPVGALTEIEPACAGMGELSLTLPALGAICREGRSVALVQPPYIPYAPALLRSGLQLRSLLWIQTPSATEALWAAEQLLREGAGAVLLWNAVTEDRELRRLQLAAETGKACAFLYRPPGSLQHPSPAALRVGLSAAGDGVRLEIVKARGGHPGGVTLALDRPGGSAATAAERGIRPAACAKPPT